MSPHPNKRSSSVQLKNSKRAKLSFSHAELSFDWTDNTMSDLIVDADMNLVYFAAIATVHEAFASTLRSKMIAKVVTGDTMTAVAQIMMVGAPSTVQTNPTPPRVHSESNGTPLGEPLNLNDTLAVATALNETRTLAAAQNETQTRTGTLAKTQNETQILVAAQNETGSLAAGTTQNET
jgi:hypothetical protein